MSRRPQSRPSRNASRALTVVGPLVAVALAVLAWSAVKWAF